MNAERAARLFVIGLLLGVPLAIFAAQWLKPAHVVELHARMAETGGWTPGDLTARVGEPLHLRFTSDDVQHGFAVGQTDFPAVDVLPGRMTEATLTFDKPGTYAFYCTKWCGLNHWRMRGTIEVTADSAAGTGVQLNAPTPALEPVASPLYVTLGINIDNPHPAARVPERKPWAGRSAMFGVTLPAGYLAPDYARSHTPVEVWQSLQAESPSQLSDAAVWDLVAFVWKSNTSSATLAEGQQLYAANCAACHGEQGDGKGVMAAALIAQIPDAKTPAAFANSASMLGASPALLQGKIIRGGMGTGMPSWGAIFTESQTWALVDFLWTFQFEMNK